MNWRIRPLIQDVVSLIPGPYSERINQFLSRRLSGLRNLTLNIRFTLQMVEKIRQYGREPHGLEVLEIGTGWSCVSALTLAQFGTKHIDTIDLYRHVRADSIKAAVEYILKNWPLLKLGCAPRGLNLGALPEDVLSQAGITYSAPLDLITISDRGKYELIYSEAVMEHIPAKSLPGFIDATMRMLKPGGLGYHVVTPADHFSWSAGGHGLSPYNFLKYRSRWFNLLYNPRISHQNRWRCSQYVELFKQAGFDVLDLQRDIPTDFEHLLDQLKIAPEFRGFDRDDLATTQFYILLSKR